MTLSVSWVQLDASLEFCFSAGPVPIKVELDVSQRSVSLGESVINRQRRHCCLLRLGHCFPRGYSLDREGQCGVGVRQPGVGQRIDGVLGDCLLKVLTR